MYPNFFCLQLGILLSSWLSLQGDWGAILTMNSTQLGWSEALRAAGVVSIASSVLLHVVVIRNLLADIGENSRKFKCGTTSSDQDFQSSNIFELNLNTDTLLKFMENESQTKPSRKIRDPWLLVFVWRAESALTSFFLA